MGPIAAHLRYISKGGRLPFEDDRRVEQEGGQALPDRVDLRPLDQRPAGACAASIRRSDSTRTTNPCSFATACAKPTLSPARNTPLTRSPDSAGFASNTTV